MRRVLYLQIIFGLLFFTSASFSQYDKDVQDKEPLQKTLRIQDRAAGIHNASNIGLFFENRGKLYPRFISQGPSGEFPINSAKNYIYRINQYIGIPGNVVQGRFTTNEEWEAVYGYHNSDTARVAMSDDPNSWHPTRGWPIKDANGNNIILSDQITRLRFLVFRLHKLDMLLELTLPRTFSSLNMSLQTQVRIPTIASISICIMILMLVI